MDFNPSPGSRRSRYKLDATHDRAEQADRAVRALEHEVNNLNARLERLQHACEAMWFLLKDRLGPEAPKIQDLIHEVDRRLESVEEGEAHQCPHCNRPIPTANFSMHELRCARASASPPGSTPIPISTCRRR